MNKNVVLCGSMKVKDEIIKVCDELKNKGYNVLLPKECMENLPKEIASRAHFERISKEENKKVLIINSKKDGQENYIGPNTFAEIALAFFFNKEIYLLNDIYDLYKDELLGWNVKTLKGNLDNFK